MSVPNPAPGQERQNRKILEILEEQKNRLRQQTSGPGSGMAATKDGPLAVIPSSTLPLNSNSSDSQHMAAAQKAALQHAHANSVGYFITQDSAFGNLILPVLPRFEK